MRLFLCLILLIPSAYSHGQTMVYVNSMVNQYAMNDMKSFQTDQLNQINSSTGILAKRELEFPYSIGVEAGVDVSKSDKFSIGGFLNYGLTKGRLGYSDYSGSIEASQKISRYGFGAKLQGAIHKNLCYYLKASLIYNKLELSYAVTISGTSTDSTPIGFHSIGVGVQPGVSWTYFINRLFFQIQAGYELTIQGKTYLDSDSNSYLQDSKHNNISIDWTGLRAGLGVGFKF